MRVQDVSLQLNIERNPYYVPQPGPAWAAFPHPFIPRIPTANHEGAENLRVVMCTTPMHKLVW
jgi:hypothetical protein